MAVGEVTGEFDGRRFTLGVQVEALDRKTLDAVKLDQRLVIG